MTTINGIGTKLYGKKKIATDGSFQTIKWFVFLHLPIIPLKTYRVIEVPNFVTLNKENAKSKEYKMLPCRFDYLQALRTFLTIWLTTLLVIILLVILVEYHLYYPLLYIIGGLAIFYMIYEIFIKSKD
jgi:hypothetical protein